MNFKNNTFSAILILLLCYTGSANAIPAFPGAEGFGANSVGGRGGTVKRVINLNDSGAGSFREAVTASGPRIVVFAVSGIINLLSDLRITTPYLTIAGQTSPGGILITGRTIIIQTHNVIVQHMRFRAGSQNITLDRDINGNIIYYNQAQYNFPPNGLGGTCLGTLTTEASGYPCAIAGGADPEQLDTVRVVGTQNQTDITYNIIFDHCSFSWGIDEVFGTDYDATKITVQWSIISEALSKAGHPEGEHSKGILIFTDYSPNTIISLHHNYIAHNRGRSPLINGTGGDVLLDAVNNVIYNFGGLISMATQEKGKANWIHNYVKPGPQSTATAYEAIHVVTNFGSCAAPPAEVPEQLIYVEGNIGLKRTSQSDFEWSVGYAWCPLLSPLDTGYQKNTKWPVPASASTTPPVTTTEMSSAVADCILTGVGATAPVRDSVDTRVVLNFSSTTTPGAIINNVTYPTDFPILNNNNDLNDPAPPTDSDNDSMADSWEEAEGLSVGTNDSALDKDNDGYTNIEEYLHYLSVKSYTLDRSCMLDKTPPARPLNLSSQ